MKYAWAWRAVSVTTGLNAGLPANDVAAASMSGRTATRSGSATEHPVGDRLPDLAGERRVAAHRVDVVREPLAVQHMVVDQTGEDAQQEKHGPDGRAGNAQPPTAHSEP